MEAGWPSARFCKSFLPFSQPIVNESGYNLPKLENWVAVNLPVIFGLIGHAMAEQSTLIESAVRARTDQKLNAGAKCVAPYR